MWKYDHIINLEIGSKIVEAANTRTMVQKLYKSNNVDLLIAIIRQLREHLNSQGIFLPAIHIEENENLRYNEYMCYWGLEKFQGKINNLNEFYQILVNKAYQYEEWDWNKSAVRETLKDCLKLIKDEEYQDAFEYYQAAYYIARIKGYSKECVQALTEASGLLLSLGEDYLSSSYANAAIKLVDELGIIDPSLKCQTYLNNANIAKEQGFIPISYALFGRCANMAKSGNNSFFLFLSLLGMAECCAFEGMYKETIVYYKQSLDLLSHTYADPKVANEIYRNMIATYDYLVDSLDQKVNQSSKNSVLQRLQNIFISIAEELFVSLCSSALVNILGTRSGTALIAFGTQFNLKEPIFNGTTVVGEVKQLNLK